MGQSDRQSSVVKVNEINSELGNNDHIKLKLLVQ